jgi:sn-glycerol 3-phosphate transport system permease protein
MPYLLLLPTLIFVALFTVYPVGRAFYASLHKPPRRATGEATFIGLENYLQLFDPQHFIGADFRIVFSNTLSFALATVLFSVPLALLFALLLNRKIRALGLWRFTLFYPALLPMIGAASLWAFIFADTIGLASVLMAGVGLSAPNWLGDPDLSLGAVTLVNIWKQSSFLFIFYLAGLQGIPRDIYEAADLDGAGAWAQLRYLTLPLLRRTHLFVVIVAFTNAFQSVEHLPVLGGGGPGVTSNLALYFIFQKIPERLNWGYVNAMTMVLVGVLLLFTLANLYISERRGEDERSV